MAEQEQKKSSQLSERAKHRILTTGSIKVTSECPTCSGTGINDKIFYRWCVECGVEWNDVNGDRSGSEVFEAWETNPKANEELPCGHSWLHYRERDREICDACDGVGAYVEMIKVSQLFELLTAYMAQQLRMDP